MTKYKLASAAFFALTLLPPNPVYAEDFYITGFAGVSSSQYDEFTIAPGPGAISKLSTTTGFEAGGALGLQINDYLRAEIELSTFSNPAKTLAKSGEPRDIIGDASGFMGLANIWLDLANESQFTPYAGGGIGFGSIKIDTVTADFGDPLLIGSDSGLALQFGAGIRMDVSEKFVIDVGYRFKNIQNLNFAVDTLNKQTTDVDVNIHQVLIGLTYKF